MSKKFLGQPVAGIRYRFLWSTAERLSKEIVIGDRPNHWNGITDAHIEEEASGDQKIRVVKQRDTLGRVSVTTTVDLYMHDPETLRCVRAFQRRKHLHEYPMPGDIPNAELDYEEPVRRLMLYSEGDMHQPVMNITDRRLGVYSVLSALYSAPTAETVSRPRSEDGSVDPGYIPQLAVDLLRVSTE